MNYFLITVKQRKKFLSFSKHLSLYFGSRRYFTLHTETNLFPKSQKLPGSELLAHHLCIFFIENSLLSITVAVFRKSYIHLLSNPSQNLSSSSRFDLRWSGMDPDVQFTAQIFSGSIRALCR